MDASIVIRAFNEEDHLPRLLEEIEKQETDYDFETILVDSGSTDSTVDIARSHEARIHRIKPENFTFGYSLNQGIEQANGRFCVIVSAHCYPATDRWLDNLLELFENEDDALVYGKQRGNHVTRFSEHQVFARWFPEESIENQETPFCNNANAAIRRSVWEDFQYDEDLTGLEDLDWARRVRERGYRIHYAADAPVYHVHEETNSEIFNRYKREAIAFKDVFPEEQFSFLDFVQLFFSNVFSDYYHALLDGELLANFLDIPRFRFLQFWGTYQGYQFKDSVNKDLRQRFYYPRKSKNLNWDTD